MFMYKVRHNKRPKSTDSLFSICSNTLYNFRRNKLITRFKNPTPTLLKKSAIYSGVTLWNNLPKDRKNRSSQAI